MPADVLVVGGGVAGGAVAAYLARAGRHVVLLERKNGPHDKVCGEFVSGEAADYLRVLDIDVERSVRCEYQRCESTRVNVWSAPNFGSPPSVSPGAFWTRPSYSQHRHAGRICNVATQLNRCVRQTANGSRTSMAQAS